MYRPTVTSRYNRRMTRLAMVLVLLGACKDTGGGTKASTGAMAQMEKFRDAMCACKDAACAKKVSGEMAEWGKSQSSDKPGAMNADDQKRATEIGTRLGECLANATRGTNETLAGSAATGSAGSAATGSAESAATGSAGSGVDADTGSGSATPRAPRNKQGLPVECDDYRDAITKLQTCETLARSARDTLVKGFEEASARWAAMNESAKATLAVSCQGGAEAVTALAKEKCGW